MTHIEIYKTSLQSDQESMKLILRLLEKCFQTRVKFDLDDQDRILKIESDHPIPRNGIMELSEELDIYIQHLDH